jgi:hypothetical protein
MAADFDVLLLLLFFNLQVCLVTSTKRDPKALSGTSITKISMKNKNKKQNKRKNQK